MAARPGSAVVVGEGEEEKEGEGGGGKEVEPKTGRDTT